MRVNVSLPDSSFTWAPPTGAEKIVPPEVLLGQPAPDVALADLDGKQLRLSDLRGNVVILDFWATWCGPCRRSLPMLEQVAQDNHSAKLRVLTVAVNRGQTPEAIREFVQENKLSLPVLWDEKSEAGDKFHVRGIPQTVLIGKDGVVKFVAVGVGPDGESRLQQAIHVALEAP